MCLNETNHNTFPSCFDLASELNINSYNGVEGDINSYD